ncbi:L-aspartate oxidase [Peribacillus deserti]|uniref:L-aspartate oxidase n=1 Tax=Peribacillus deserti TaxID=673318 RepID=A0ABS2QFU7_9BACI|nr:L-aspartate oxidase [Peribacillus deserti]MBM7691905.1 L-aspartate oxidase [Peribacillus deserti]
MVHTDVLIIGSGIAALQTALEAAIEKNVIIITKSIVRNSNSYLAQGGVAASVAPMDTVDNHVEDTLAAGCRHNNSQAVYEVIEKAPDAIQDLIESGFTFDYDAEGKLALGLEGAHGERRILHSKGDSTGKELIEHLLNKVQQNPNIKIIENQMAIKLLKNVHGECIGAVCKDGEDTAFRYFAHHTVLAAGGCGALYEYTSNSPEITGSGLALALKAGAELADMEFIQFHPTLLFVDGETKGLISEAVRGEGARLVTDTGYEIMNNVHPLRELAPRHIVAQTIFSYLEDGIPVYLDIAAITDFETRFPSIAALCESTGIHVSRGRLPVAPGAHFLMGGIKTDLKGRTAVPFLYAVGEAACTGVHGANRLASNSLLEGLVIGKNLGMLLGQQTLRPQYTFQIHDEEVIETLRAPCLPDISELKSKMMKHAGIMRNDHDLTCLINWLESFSIDSILHANYEIMPLEETNQMLSLLTAYMIAGSAIERLESRGSHCRSDFPHEKEDWEGKMISWNVNRLTNKLKRSEYVEQN